MSQLRQRKRGQGEGEGDDERIDRRDGTRPVVTLQHLGRGRVFRERVDPRYDARVDGEVNLYVAAVAETVVTFEQS